jgi:hypothetical protein
MKHLCIIGPTRSGKTVFIYLFLHKLLLHNDLNKEMLINFDDAIIRALDSKVEDVIDDGKWPKPTQKNESARVIKLLFKKNNFFINDKIICIPDVAGEVFEDLTEKITKDQSKSLNAIKDADAYILLVDSPELKENGGGRFYRRFLTNFIEKINKPGFGKRCNKPLLVLLNKSDLILKGKKLYGDPSGAEEYIKNNAVFFYARIVNSFEPDMIDYAWHSSITNTLTATDGSTILPDYDSLRKYDPIEYTESIIQFLGKI